MSNEEIGFLNRSGFENDGDTLHDFRKCKARWGWKGLNLTRIAERTHHMRGIERGIKAGHIIITDYSSPDEKIVGYKVKSIKYHWNPRDLFDAVLEGPYGLDESVYGKLGASLH